MSEEIRRYKGERRKRKIKKRVRFLLRLINVENEKIVENYLLHPDEYVREFTVTVNGRKKKITTYAKGIKGDQLLGIHAAIVKKLSARYEFASNSYAFQKGTGVKQCIEQHLNSTRFFKTDIHKYFDSITFENVSKKIKKTKLLPKFHQDKLLAACFYKGTLPIGFISSPIISDVYLHDFDQCMLSHNGLIYTRYADDLIFSVNADHPEINFGTIREEVEELIAKEHLELNYKKTYTRYLNQEGDAIHLLGVNLVRQEGKQNRITIGNKFIKDTSKAIAELLTMPAEEAQKRLYEVSGKISFIKYYSEESFAKLERMFNAHTKLGISLTRANLEAIVDSRVGRAD